MGLITLPSTLVAHTTAAAGDVNADLNAIVNQVNGNLDSSNLKDAAVTPTKIATTPVGIVNAPVQNLLTGQFTTMTFSVEEDDTDNMVDLVSHNDRVTIITAGVYIVEAQVRHVYHADTARRISNIVHIRSGSAINGAGDARVNVGNAGGGGDTLVPITQVIGCLAGDYFQIQAFQDSGVTTTMDGHLAVARMGSN